jgi:hypothetical protein
MDGVIRTLKAIGAVVSTALALVAGEAMAAGIQSVTGHAPSPSPVAASACTSDPITVGYTLAYAPALQADAVTGVTLTDTSPSPALEACTGASYRVTLLDANGDPLGEVIGTVPAGVTSFSSTAGLTEPVAADRVSETSLVLGG